MPNSNSKSKIKLKEKMTEKLSILSSTLTKSPYSEVHKLKSRLFRKAYNSINFDKFSYLSDSS